MSKTAVVYREEYLQLERYSISVTNSVCLEFFCISCIKLGVCEPAVVFVYVRNSARTTHEVNCRIPIISLSAQFVRRGSAVFGLD